MIYYKEKSDYISAPKARHVTSNFNTLLRSYTSIGKIRDLTPTRFNYPIRLSAEYPLLSTPPPLTPPPPTSISIKRNPNSRSSVEFKVYRLNYLIRLDRNSSR